MKHSAVIEIDSRQLESYEKMFSYGEIDLIEKGIPPLENIKTFTAKFPTGIEVDIKLNSSEDDIWSEGVIFDSNGNELGHTDVCDNLKGEWTFEILGDEYVVEVKPV